MATKPKYVKFFDELGIGDVGEVGGKNASLGEMTRNLKNAGVPVPFGFATTSAAYDATLDYNKKDYFNNGEEITLREYIRRELNSIGKQLKSLKPDDVLVVDKTVARIRNAIETAEYDPEVKKQITEAYRKLEEATGGSAYAIRSSATAEDLPDASFAGQQDTYLNILGEGAVLDYTLKCMASVFTTRATQYRERAGFDHFAVKLSVGVQEMAGGKQGVKAAGVAFSIDPDSGNRNFITIRGAWGLGERIVQGQEVGDEWLVFKYGTLGPTLVSSTLVPKAKMLVFDELGTKEVAVPKDLEKTFALTPQDVEQLARYVLAIENHYGKPMDVEWAKGKNGKLYIVQARPETVESQKGDKEKIFYLLEDEDTLIKQKKLLYDRGVPIGRAIGSGAVNIIPDIIDAHKLRKGDVLVTGETNPDWTAYMQHLGAVVTEKGGPTCHAAIVSRELGIPGIVGSDGFIEHLRKWVVSDDAAKYRDKNGELKVTVDCSQGRAHIWKGEVAYDFDEIDFGELPRPKTKILVNLGMKDAALSSGKFPDGTGLARLEFIITDDIQIHPNLLLNYDRVKKMYQDKVDLITEIEKQKGSKLSENDPLVLETAKLKQTLDEVEKVTEGYSKDKVDFYVQKLAEGMATIAGAVWKNLDDGTLAEAVVRMSDFKSNEYANLIGGWLYEPDEHNPMIGFRGASRYIHPKFEEAFRLECRALKRARDWGLKNIVPMIPFCRTIEEAKAVQKIMAEEGLVREEVVQYLANKTGWSRNKILNGVVKRGKVRDAVFRAIDKCKNAPAEYPMGLKMYVMAEIPSNVVIADQFCKLFDGFSIGSNDLTQLTFGVDRDNEILAAMANEFGYGPNTDALMRTVSSLINTAHSFKIDGKPAPRKVGICGQAPSDFPEFLQFLVREGIDSISLNFDTFAKGKINAYRTEIIEKNLESDEQKSRIYQLLNQYDSMINELRIPNARMKFISRKLESGNKRDDKLLNIVSQFERLFHTLKQSATGVVEMVELGQMDFENLMKTTEAFLSEKQREREALLVYANQRWKLHKNQSAN